MHLYIPAKVARLSARSRHVVNKIGPIINFEPIFSHLSSLFRNRSKFWFIPNVLTIDFEKLRLRVLVLKQEKRKKTQRHRGHVGGE